MATRAVGASMGCRVFGPLCAVVLIVAVVPIDVVASTGGARQPGQDIFGSWASTESSQAAAALPAGFFDEKMASVEATTFQFHTDGRIFLAEKGGRVRLIKNGLLHATPVINISDHVNRAVDRGLLGLALDKNFTANGYLYLAYTVERHGQPESTDPRTACITRVTVVGDTASPASEYPDLGKDGCGDVDSCIELPVGADCLAADFTSHGNGAIRVDAAGNLWITMGDGSLFNHAIAAGRAQGLDHLNGKLLRVTPLGKGVPSNPFWNGNADAVRSKVYAYGLRNPFRFNAKPGGPVYLGDVGGTRFEEIDVATPGANFGWPCYENNVRHPAYQSHSRCQALYAAGPTAVKAPLHAYSHNGGSAGITGGVFYTGPSTEFNGVYIYADFIKREFRSLRVNAANTAVTSGPTVFGTSVGTPVEIQMGPDGCLWYAAFRTPTIQAGLRRIVPPPATARRSPWPRRPPISVRCRWRCSSPVPVPVIPTATR